MIRRFTLRKHFHDLPWVPVHGQGHGEHNALSLVWETANRALWVPLMGWTSAGYCQPASPNGPRNARIGSFFAFLQPLRLLSGPPLRRRKLVLPENRPDAKQRCKPAVLTPTLDLPSATPKDSSNQHRLNPLRPSPSSCRTHHRFQALKSDPLIIVDNPTLQTEPHPRLRDSQRSDPASIHRFFRPSSPPIQPSKIFALHLYHLQASTFTSSLSKLSANYLIYHHHHHSFSAISVNHL